MMPTMLDVESNDTADANRTAPQIGAETRGKNIGIRSMCQMAVKAVSAITVLEAPMVKANES